MSVIPGSETLLTRLNAPAVLRPAGNQNTNKLKSIIYDKNAFVVR